VTKTRRPTTLSISGISLPLLGGLGVASVFRCGCVSPAGLLRSFAFSLTCPPVRRGPVLPLSSAFSRLASPVALCSLAV